MSIFKAYDIRGLVEGELSKDLAYSIGFFFVKILQKNGFDVAHKAIVVGRDMRPSSFVFQEAVMKGIQDAGVNVVDIGLTSTPLFNFACAHYPEHAGGIMITASHNPAQYNGFKLTMGDGLPVGKNTGMDVLQKLVEKGEYLKNSKKGIITSRSVLEDYIKTIFTLVDPHTIKPLNIVIDAGNGMAEATFPKLLAHLPVQVEYLYLEPDGTFPNHEANPLKTETLKDLQKKVLETQADFGFALDGDCDRIGLVDEEGQIVEASYVGALIGLEVLKSNPHGYMLYDLRSSRVVKEVWEAEGATTEMCMVGHALIKKMMKEKQAVFASELSQHVYYHSMYNLESSDLSLMYLLQILSEQKKSLSKRIKPFKKYVHSGERNFEVVDKEKILKSIEEKYKNEATQVSYLDGLWMSFKWGWFNVRASNTEPVLRLNLEAGTEKEMEEKLQEVMSCII